MGEIWDRAAFWSAIPGQPARLPDEFPRAPEASQRIPAPFFLARPVSREMPGLIHPQIAENGMTEAEHPAPEWEEPKLKVPLEVCQELVSGDFSPGQASEALAPWLGISEEESRLPESAPAILREFAEDRAWSRFHERDDFTRQLFGAYLLFRAAGHLTAFQDAEASLRLIGLGKQILAELVRTYQLARSEP